MKLLIADDHDAIRENIESFLSKRSDIDVVGEAANGEDAAELAMKLPADIVLMDMDMPRLNGLEATRHILESNPETRIVILSANARKDSVVAGLRAGILGYILKSCISDDLIPALFAAMENRLFLSAQIADALAQNPIR